MAIDIRVPDFGKLYKHIIKPTLDTVILDKMLSGPIETVTVSVQSDGSDYSLKAGLLCTGVKDPLGAVRDGVRDGIDKKFRIGEKFDDYFLVNSATVGKTLSARKLLGALGQYSVEVLQSQGFLWVLGGAGLMPMAMPRRITDEAHFREDFNFFTAVLKTAMTAVYSRAGQVPELSLLVKVDSK